MNKLAFQYLPLLFAFSVQAQPWQQYEKYSGEPEWQDWVDLELKLPEPSQKTDLFGTQLLALGDVNGDGYQDIAISSPGQGRVYLYSGSADGLAEQASQEWPGQQLIAAGDINADGYADMLLESFEQGKSVSLQVYLGSTAGLKLSHTLTLPEHSRVFSAGDIDNDRHADVLVASGGCHDLNSNRAHIEWYRGAPSGLSDSPNQRLEFNGCAGTELGQNIHSAGDYNGDGYGDIWLAAPKYSDTHIAQGRVQLFLGSQQGLSESPAVQILGERSLDRLGFSLSASFDINNDGYADSLLATQSGKAVMYLGNAKAELQAGQRYPLDASQEGKGSVNSFYAWDHSALHDHNADQKPDWVVASPGLKQRYAGKLYFYGGVEKQVLQAPKALVGFANQVVNIDINGDGMSELLVSAPEQGRVYVHNGHPRELINAREARQQWLDERLSGLLRSAQGQQGLDQASQSALQEVAELLQAEPQWRLAITGHSCDIGSEVKKSQISLHRATVVHQWFRHGGIAPERLVVEAVADQGFATLLERASSEQEKEKLRQQNRKVSLRLLN